MPAGISSAIFEAGDVRYAARGLTPFFAWGSTLKRIVVPADT